jgi:N-acetylglutamate synthase-like GNAT family acetyltransferase
MTTPMPQVRRATIEDLPKLMALWKLENLPVEHLEQRFKEFQVLEDDQGEVLGALGLQIAGQEGLLHSEAFARSDLADALRAHLFERIRTVAANHGLVRLWTQFSAPYWRNTDFDVAPHELLCRLPPAFGSSPQPWLYLKLREEPIPTVSLEKELALFKEAEHENIRRIQRQAKIARAVAFVVVVAVFALMAVWALFFFNKGRLPR